MKTCFNRILWTCLLPAALLLAGSSRAQNPIRYEAQPGAGKVRIDGTSTLHDWAVESRAVGGFMELDAAFDADLKTLTSQPKVEVNVPVRQLKNTEGKKSMDNVMYEHMHLKDYQAIKYRLLDLTAKPGGAGASQFDARGELTISGVTRTNTMAITMERIDKTKIKVNGATSLKMTDFGIKPPAPSILGLAPIKTGDDVNLTFDWTVAQPEKPSGGQ